MKKIRIKRTIIKKKKKKTYYLLLQRLNDQHRTPQNIQLLSYNSLENNFSPIIPLIYMPSVNTLLSGPYGEMWISPGQAYIGNLLFEPKFSHLMSCTPKATFRRSNTRRLYKRYPIKNFPLFSHTPATLQLTLCSLPTTHAPAQLN